MNNSELFKSLVEEHLADESSYKLQIDNFCKFLSDNDLMDKVFNLDKHHIDNYFEYALIDNIGTPSQVNSHIVALKNLFDFLIHKEYNFSNLKGHISTRQYKKNLEMQVDATLNKQVLSNELLKKILLAIDNYIEKQVKIGSQIFLEVLIARLYIKLSLLIPLKTSHMLSICIGDILNSESRVVNYNEVKVKLPNNLRKEIIFTIKYAESRYNVTYSNDNELFTFLYSCTNKNAGTDNINLTLPRVYKELKLLEMLGKKAVGKKDFYIYPAECYKITAISSMLKNGINIIYLTKLTGLDVKTIMTGFNMKNIVQEKDIVSANINCTLMSCYYFEYL